MSKHRPKGLDENMPVEVEKTPETPNAKSVAPTLPEPKANRKEKSEKVSELPALPYGEDTATELIIKKIEELNKEADDLETTATQRRWDVGYGFVLLRKRTPHGEWGALLKERFPWTTERSINNWIRLATTITREEAAKLNMTDATKATEFWEGADFETFRKEFEALAKKLTLTYAKLQKVIVSKYHYARSEDKIKAGSRSVAFQHGKSAIVPILKTLSENAAKIAEDAEKTFDHHLGNELKKSA